MRLLLGPISLLTPQPRLAARSGLLHASAPRADESWPLLTSKANPKIQLIKKLHSRRQREKSGLMLLEGHRLVIDALDAGFAPDFVLLHDGAVEDAAEGARLRAALAVSGSPVLRAPEALVAEASDTTTPQGVLAVVRCEPLPLPASPSLVLVCDSVADPGNLGTLLRSAAGAGADAALLTSGCSDAWGLKALRAGMGAQLRLPVRSGLAWADAAAQLRAWGCAPRAADASARRAHFDVDWRRPSALVVGSEAHGLSPEVRGECELVAIPLGGGGAAEQQAALESLNAAVAGSVVLFEAQRQRLSDLA